MSPESRILKVSKKEYELIMFIRDELKFGQCLLTTHCGQPERVENINRKKIFGIGDNPVENSENQLKKGEVDISTE